MARRGRGVMALVVEAMGAAGPWARRMRLMARFRRAAMTCGALPVRSWWRSSPVTTSRTRWRRLYESAGGAVPSFPRVVSPGRSSEPGVPVSRHRALREPASGLWWRGCAGPRGGDGVAPVAVALDAYGGGVEQLESLRV